MKKNVLLLALLPLFVNAEQLNGSSGNICPQKFIEVTNQLNEMRLSQASSNTLLFFGDSIVQALNPNSMHMRYVNLGIGGDNVRGMFDKLKNTPIERYDGVFISVGANDFLQGKSGVTLGEDIAKVIDYSAPRTKKLFVMEPFVPSRQLNPTVTMDFAKAQVEIHVACQRYRHCQVIPLPEGMIGKEGIEAKYSLKDGIHLNATGYALWKRELNKKMADFPVNYYYRLRYLFSN